VIAEQPREGSHDDPTWSWAFGSAERRLEHLRRYWGLMMHSAIPYEWVWMTGDRRAAAAANLVMLDELGMPAYLESSNRANDRRYERLGFELIGEFAAPGGSPTVGWMCREPR
jgi:hypothetical protein